MNIYFDIFLVENNKSNIYLKYIILHYGLIDIKHNNYE
jgi:hypothetical protein